MASSWTERNSDARLVPTTRLLLPEAGAWPGTGRVQALRTGVKLQLILWLSFGAALVVGWLDELALVWLADRVSLFAPVASGSQPVLHALWEALLLLPLAALARAALYRTYESMRFVEGTVACCPHCERVESAGRWSGFADYLTRNTELRLVKLECQSCKSGKHSGPIRHGIEQR